ncbi:MAG: sulfatase [Bacteroidota bacterium]
MKSKYILAIVGLPVLIYLSIFFSPTVEKNTPITTVKQRPNVLMIVVDDMNGYSSKDQYPLIQMPYLDKFRAQSINFVSAACNVPICSPSRASFLSGLFPHHTGGYFNGGQAWNKSEVLQQIRSLPECFKDNGYTTWGGGKLFHTPLEKAREQQMWDNYPVFKGGFGPFGDEKFWQKGSRFRNIQPWEGPDTDFPDVKNANAAVEFLQEEHDQPFFMFYGLWRPHSPYTAPKRFYELYDKAAITPPKGRTLKDLDDVPHLATLLVDSLKNYQNDFALTDSLYLEFIHAYCANSSFTDWNLGRVIETLDNSPYAENTIVVFFSDNGFHCGEKERWGKSTLWEQADYVPMMIRTPQTKGATSKAPVSLIDVYPTLIDYCDLKAPEHQLDGRSIVPLLSKPNKKWNYPSLTTYGVNYSSVRDARYRYLLYPDGTEELYDYETDPFEQNNIAALPKMKKIKAELAKHIPNEWAPITGGRLSVRRKFEDVMREPMSK